MIEDLYPAVNVQAISKGYQRYQAPQDDAGFVDSENG